MDIMQSPLANEINAVFNAGPAGAIYYYRAEITANGATWPFMKVVSIDRYQDFEKAIADVVMLKVIIGAGTYTYRIFPYLSNLEITVYRTSLYETQGSTNPNVPIATQYYRATLKDPKAPAVEANRWQSPSEEALNLGDIMELEFQLQDMALEQMRMITTGGIYRNCRVQDVIQNVMTRESAVVDVDGTQVPIGVQMINSVNTQPRDHVVLPHGLQLTQVPEYIHRHCGGVYGAGFSSYFINSIWYIYPTYDTTRYDQDAKSLTVVRVPSSRLPAVQRTFTVTNGALKVIATGDGQTHNSSESSIYNEGNGVRFADADKYMGSFNQTKDNKTLVSRGSNNNEFTTISRETNLNNVRMSSARITANSLYEYSKLAYRDGSYLLLGWENSNPDLLIPGMQVKVMYLENDVVSEVYGVLLKAHHYTEMGGQGLTAARHVTNSTLVVFAKRTTSLATN